MNISNLLFTLAEDVNSSKETNNLYVMDRNDQWHNLQVEIALNYQELLPKSMYNEELIFKNYLDWKYKIIV